MHYLYLRGLVDDSHFSQSLSPQYTEMFLSTYAACVIHLYVKYFELASILNNVTVKL